jgi:hypothetical protein
MISFHGKTTQLHSKFTDFSEVVTTLLIRAMKMMEVKSTSETSLNLYESTQHNNPEDSHVQTDTILPLFQGSTFNISSLLTVAIERLERLVNSAWNIVSVF